VIEGLFALKLEGLGRRFDGWIVADINHTVASLGIDT
jgi:hypothetical protein